MIYKTKTIFCLAILVILALHNIDHCMTQELTAQEALDMLEGSIQSIKSFDVTMMGTRQMYIITERSTKLTGGRKEFVISNRRTLAAGEQPKILRKLFHQVFQRGKGRIEFFNEGGDNTGNNYLVYDNETQKTWDPGQRIASISSSHLAPVMDGMDYRECYLTILGGAHLMKCLRQRKNCIVKRMTPNDPLNYLGGRSCS